MKIKKELEKVKEYHRSRKFVLYFIILIFFNSVITLSLRGRQRNRNLEYISEQVHLTYQSQKDELEKIIEYVESKSRNEDMIMLISTNFIALIMLIGFDRLGAFEKTGETYRANKEKIKRGINKINIFL
jgi:predicted nucleic acid-binding Zn ribbon protein